MKYINSSMEWMQKDVPTDVRKTIRNEVNAHLVKSVA